MERLFMRLAVGLMVLFTLANPWRTAGQRTEPDQTPPAGSPTSAPPQAPVPHPVSQCHGKVETSYSRQTRNVRFEGSVSE
jgi:hypothetical protein